MVRQVSTPLTRKQVILARKLNLFCLLRPIVAQHSLDGGVQIEAGRMVYLLKKRDVSENFDEFTYVCTELVVAAPNIVDPQNDIPDDTIILRGRPSKPLRFMVCPQGKELAWVRDAARRSRISDPCLR